MISASLLCKLCDAECDCGGAANRRKMAVRVAELEDAAEQARNRANKLEKDKNKLQIEVRDLTVQLDSVSRRRRLLVNDVVLVHFYRIDHICKSRCVSTYLSVCARCKRLRKCGQIRRRCCPLPPPHRSLDSRIPSATVPTVTRPRPRFVASRPPAAKIAA